ncbi:MAG: M1 family metallopeptidase, partial [Gemmatimonadetes bacterium]|nr:M1 family metallopeptidase [Gemmatimonadota bacterium]NIS02259.1 M1 family metallopeptidase [Gemmatimonadota bacterium]NIT66667.1 M1 family metallopeptidase [Gemmatimonadota bacterium]NIU54289.1 M1 family peptidase [Gemmatimonadota bacterium]NIV24708.1 M1 family peptidase [Gemmatimonadota bacterium]
SVMVFYGGVPRDGLRFRPNLHGDPTVFADNWPDRARYWFPCVDHPGDKAAVELRVRAPGTWSVVGVGGKVSEQRLPDGRKETVWSTRRPIPVYTIVFGAAELVVGNAGALGCEDSGERCVPIDWWMYPADAVHGRTIFRRAGEIVAFFDSLIGPFPYEKLALVQSTTRYGAMENSSVIFLSEQAARGSSIDALIAHEVAHQWFGDAVTPGEWTHLWLSEGFGFATYLSTIFFERTGALPFARQRMVSAERAYMAAPNAVASPVIGERPRNLQSLLNPNNYQKAAWVLHMLRARVGDETFFDSLRRYYDEYRDATALSEDFQRIVEEEYG